MAIREETALMHCASLSVDTSPQPGLVERQVLDSVARRCGFISARFGCRIYVVHVHTYTHNHRAPNHSNIIREPAGQYSSPRAYVCKYIYARYDLALYDRSVRVIGYSHFIPLCVGRIDFELHRHINSRIHEIKK